MSRAIRFTVVESDLGPLLLAASERGVCHIRFGEDAAALVDALRGELPFAVLRCDDTGLAPWAQALAQAVAAGTAPPALPLDVPGSRFERRVWAALRAIPCGEVRSYAAVARAVGVPRAARAVAGACARNPVPLVVPCHRVVRSDGRAGGYRHGEARKRALLQREAAAAAGASGGPERASQERAAPVQPSPQPGVRPGLVAPFAGSPGS